MDLETVLTLLGLTDVTVTEMSTKTQEIVSTDQVQQLRKIALVRLIDCSSFQLIQRVWKTIQMVWSR